jgi:hypothetical protein
MLAYAEEAAQTARATSRLVVCNHGGAHHSTMEFDLTAHVLCSRITSSMSGRGLVR